MPKWPSFAVVVPTWKRPDALTVCLRALSRQTLLPQRVVVAAKEGDVQTVEAIEKLQTEGLPLRMQIVTAGANGNVITQQNAGVAVTTEQIVALTDDDAEPHEDWLERLAPYYQNPRVGGVGGRDWQPHERSNVPKVGKITWFGRLTGNHHLGCGPAREVDVLKGVNWSFRGDLIRSRGFDLRMRGSGTVMNFEIALSLALRRDGWVLIYDPAAAVDHHVIVRQDGDVNTRGGFEARSYIDSVHNETVGVLEYFPGVSRRGIYLLWAVFVGTRGAPGLAQLPRLAMERQRFLIPRWFAACKGRIAGIRTVSGGDRRSPLTSHPTRDRENHA